MLLSKFEIPKKRPELDCIFHDVSKNDASNIDKDTVQFLVSKLIHSMQLLLTKQNKSKSLFF